MDRLAAQAVAAALGLAYLDAKHFVGRDLHSIMSVVRAQRGWVVPSSESDD